jgi:hypothetical protein
MRRILRRCVTLVAIYAVALNVIFLGLAPIAANAAAVDPFSVICHSIARTQGDEAPKSGLIPGHACEHCNLCSAVAPGVALNVDFRPARILQVLHPASAPTHAGVTPNPKLARGPPRFV